MPAVKFSKSPPTEKKIVCGCVEVFAKTRRCSKKAVAAGKPVVEEKAPNEKLLSAVKAPLIVTLCPADSATKSTEGENKIVSAVTWTIRTEEDLLFPPLLAPLIVTFVLVLKPWSTKLAALYVILLLCSNPVELGSP